MLAGEFALTIAAVFTGSSDLHQHRRAAGTSSARQPLSPRRVGVPLLAAHIRDARPCRFTCHARSAIPLVASTEGPQITALNPQVFARSRWHGKAASSHVGSAIQQFIVN